MSVASFYSVNVLQRPGVLRLTRCCQNVPAFHVLLLRTTWLTHSRLQTRNIGSSKFPSNDNNALFSRVHSSFSVLLCANRRSSQRTSQRVHITRYCVRPHKPFHALHLRLATATAYCQPLLASHKDPSAYPTSRQRGLLTGLLEVVNTGDPIWYVPCAAP